MIKMTEYEKKVLLTEKEYLIIEKTLCKNETAKIQVNYYFDNDTFDMNKKGITYRVREKNGLYVSTIKIHGCEDDCNTEINGEAKDKLDENAFDDLGLTLKGSLVTERTIAYQCKNLNVSLDRNAYLGYIDYEIEIEYLNNFEDKAIKIVKVIAEILKENGCIENIEDFYNRVNVSKNKSKRFFERLIKLN